MRCLSKLTSNELLQALNQLDLELERQICFNFSDQSLITSTKRHIVDYQNEISERQPFIVKIETIVLFTLLKFPSS